MVRSSAVASVIGKSFGSIEKLPLNKTFCSTIYCIGVIIGSMSEKQFEENLNYGDCFNFVGRIGDLLGGIFEKVEKTFDKVTKKE